MYAIIATTALLASSAFALSVGNAVVVNKCSYDVTLCAVPSEFGGYPETDKKLSSGEKFTQQWTQLTNDQGWSIKLSNSSDLTDILQYEYTFHNDGQIWYDLSEVNGNPWDGNWEITAECESGTCTPKQQAYRYATDDAYGMQQCPQDSTITVTLCSGDESNDGAAASASSSVAAETSSAAASTISSYSAPAESTPATTWAEEAVASTTSTEVSTSSSPTTFATMTSAAQANAVTSSQAGPVIVTEYETAVVTNVVTYTHWHGHHGKRAPTGLRHAHN